MEPNGRMSSERWFNDENVDKVNSKFTLELNITLFAKDSLLTSNGQEQACTRITRLFV